MSENCKNIQKSLGWCEGTPELAGVRRRVYYLSKGEIVKWPNLAKDDKGKVTAASYTGDFGLASDVKWKYIEILPTKSKLTSEAQGEAPSQTQLNKLTLVHPGVGPEASAAAAYINNTDNVFLVQDMNGRWRVVGSELYETKNTVSQDNGDGPTGSTATTIEVEATDLVPAPFYTGKVETEDGDFKADGTPII